MKINSTRLYEGSGTFTKNGDIDYDINLPAEVAENDFDFFEHYDISNPKANGVVILVKPESVIAESDQTTKKYNHKFNIKQLKRYNSSTGFNVSTQDGNVMVINCNEVTNEVKEIIEHFYNNLLHKDRPVSVGTGVIRGPLVK